VNRLSEQYGGQVGGQDQGILSHPLELQSIVYGVIIIAFVIFKPEGLIGIARSVKDLAVRTLGGGGRG
jgi:ABC-type branched-subunit amino acid transport system permease subunit